MSRRLIAKHSNYFVGGVFTLVGGLVVVLGIASLISLVKFRETAQPVTAVITGIRTYRRGSDTRHDVYVGYIVDGKGYKGKLSCHSSSMREGQGIKILYNPANPLEIRSESAATPYWVSLGFGGLFFVVGVLFLLVHGRRRLRIRHLLALGTRVDAAVLDISINTSRSVTISKKKMHPWRITCEWTDPASGVRHEFVSGHVWELPENLLSPPSGAARSVPVYIDPANPRDYHVDAE